jgi:hypothetical protein
MENFPPLFPEISANYSRKIINQSSFNKIMNPKQTVPLVVTLAPFIAAAPPLLIGAAIGLGLIWLFSEDEKAKPATKPAEAKPESSWTSAKSIVKTPLVRQTPAEIPIKPVRVPVTTPPLSVPSAPKTTTAAPAPVVVPAIKAVIQAPPPIKRKIVTRQDVAAIFQNGARELSRTAAVAALKRLGFGRTAAYAALSAHGRFASWLNHAPDGIISWTDGRTI